MAESLGSAISLAMQTQADMRDPSAMAYAPTPGDQSARGLVLHCCS